MAYKVALRKNDTGEVRMIENDFDFADAGEYMWTGGNYGCDCNRSLFFARAKNEDEPDIECGEDAYTALYAELPDGTRVVLDAPKN